MSTQPVSLTPAPPEDVRHAPPELPTPPSPSDALAAAGHPIKLIDGATVSMRYSMASLRVLEARFGSLRGIEHQIKEAAAGLQSDEVGARGPIMTVLSDAIAPGLLHVRVRHPDTQAIVRLGADQALVMEQLDPAQLQPYVNAFAAALSQAFGSEGKAVGESVTAATIDSPGPSGTTQPSSSPVDLTDSSGA